MKVIDLLNKMSNGEEVPKKIKHQYYDYEWNTIDKDYQTRDGEMLLGNMNIQYHLNDEIILIEDKVDIDNIEELNDTCYDEENITSEEKEYYHNLTREQQNTILRAVKQLDKRVKELEELNIEISEKDINEAINKAREQRNKEIKSIKEE